MNALKLFAVVALMLCEPAIAQERIVRTFTETVTVTPVISASSAYTAGDAVGGLMTFTNAVKKRMNTALLISAVIVDEADQGDEMEIVCMHSTWTATADNSPMAVSDADALLAVVTFKVEASDYVDLGGVQVATKASIGKSFAIPTGRSLFCQMKTTGTPTYAATNDLTVKLTFLQD